MANIGLTALKQLINLVISRKFEPDKIQPEQHNGVLMNLIDTFSAIIAAAPMSPAQTDAYQQLFAGLPVPIQLSEIGVDTIITIMADTWLEKISCEDVSGNPTVSIGTVPGGVDVMESQLILGLVPYGAKMRFKDETLLYVSVSGGVVNIRFDVVPNFFKNTLSGVSTQATYTQAEINAALLLKADKLKVLMLDGVELYERPASQADVSALIESIADKADYDNVLLLNGATLDKQPASLADLGLKLLWMGDIAINGATTKKIGSLTLTGTCIGSGIYNFTHNLNATNYIVMPGMGTTVNDLVSPRSCFNRTSTGFTIRTSSDNSGNNAPFSLIIYKY